MIAIAIFLGTFIAMCNIKKVSVKNNKFFGVLLSIMAMLRISYRLH